jgi:flap endonuclease-1
MGIRGLSGYLKWKAPSTRSHVVWSHHAGERWAIDCSCLLYRARAVGLQPITVIASLLVRMRSVRITPVVIFDGKPPVVKSDTIEQRKVVREDAQREMNELRGELQVDGLSEVERAEKELRVSELQAKAPQVSARDRDDIKKFLYAAGILFLSATGEADDVLALMARTGHIQAVVSSDMDMLARGVPLLIIPETHDATVLSEICLADVLRELRLTYQQFVDACVLMGSDYSPADMKTMEPRFAVEAVRRGDGMPRCEHAANLLMGVDARWEDLLAETQQKKWADGAPPIEPENLDMFCCVNGWPADWFTILVRG